MELIKQTIKLGNSAGVLLPKEYLNTHVKIILEPLNIEKEILEILLKEDLLKETKGIYVTGSYARGEQNIESDIDMLVITSKTEKKIKEGKYDIILISQDSLEKTLKNNIMPLLPMIKESKSIMNKDLIEKHKKNPLTKKNLKFYIDVTKSGLKLNEASLKLSKELGSKYSNDAVSYSLILHLRSVYIVKCLIKNKLPNKKDFLSLIKKITGSVKAYEGYIRAKSNKKSQEKLPIKEAKDIIKYISKEIKKHEKWLKTKKE